MSARSRKVRSIVLMIVLTLVLSAALARITPSADATVRLGAGLRMVGFESIENLYFACVPLVALVSAMLIVALFDRARAGTR